MSLKQIYGLHAGCSIHRRTRSKRRTNEWIRPKRPHDILFVRLNSGRKFIIIAAADYPRQVNIFNIRNTWLLQIEDIKYVNVRFTTPQTWAFVLRLFLKLLFYVSYFQNKAVPVFPWEVLHFRNLDYGSGQHKRGIPGLRFPHPNWLTTLWFGIYCAPRRKSSVRRIYFYQV